MHCLRSPESLDVACAPDSPAILSIYRGLDPALYDDYYQAIQSIPYCESITTTTILVNSLIPFLLSPARVGHTDT